MRWWIAGLTLCCWPALAAATSSTVVYDPRASSIETLIPDHQATAQAELIAAERVLDYAQQALDAHDAPQFRRALGEYHARLQAVQLDLVRARAQGQLTSPMLEACKEQLGAHRERLTGWLAGASRQEQGALRHALQLAEHAYHEVLVELMQQEVYSRHTSMQPINEVPTYGTE